MPTSPPRLTRNVWATSVTSFLTDISSEMLANVLPLFLANVVGVTTVTIGLIEGVAESAASLLKLYSGWLSDRLRARKWLAVGGYGLSAVAKPFFYFATTWEAVAGVRWADRVGKGVRTAPRDALLADSVSARRTGLAFGVHRAADTAGAVLGILGAVLVVHLVQGGGLTLERRTFQALVLVSVIPAFLAVLTLALFARDVPVGEARAPADAGGSPAGHGSAISPPERASGAPREPHPPSRRSRRSIGDLGAPYLVFVAVSALFYLGNSSDAFLILRAQERGLSVSQVLWVLVGFNAVYAVVSTPAGALSDRFSRRSVLAAGWGAYALIYLGFAVAGSGETVATAFVLYGVYQGLAAGAAKALVADLVPSAHRGKAFGVYHATLGLMNLPASLIAGALWEGVGGWAGFGAPAPFLFGAATAGAATVLLLTLPVLKPRPGA